MPTRCLPGRRSPAPGDPRAWSEDGEVAAGRPAGGLPSPSPWDRIPAASPRVISGRSVRRSAPPVKEAVMSVSTPGRAPASPLDDAERAKQVRQAEELLFSE